MSTEAGQFDLVEQTVRNLAAQHAAGVLTAEQFQALFEKARLVEVGGAWWSVAADAVTWYRYDGAGWQPANRTTPAAATTPTLPLHRQLRGHGGDVTTVAFSSGGTQLATGGDDGTLRVWDLATGTQVAVQHARGPVRFVRWLHADRHVLYAHGAVTRLATWDTVTDQHFPLLEGATSDKSALSANGAVLVTTDNAEIRVWDVNGLRQIASFTAAEPPVALATSPDGATVAAGGAEGRIQLWDTASGAERPSLLSSDIFNEVAFSPDGAQLVAGGSSLVVWELVPHQVRRELPGHTDSNVWCVAWAATGLVVTGSSVLGWDADMLGGAVHPDRTVRTWSVEPPAELHRSMILPADVSALATSADGRYLAAATSDGMVTVWTVPSG